MKLEEIYTPLEEAHVEVRRRWEDLDLRRRVEEFLGGVPPGAGDGPRAFLCRSVQTPNREFFHFMEQALSLGVAPYAVEYGDDRFCGMNSDKIGIVRMTFSQGTNKRGEAIIRRRFIVAGNTCLGVPFNRLATYWGENLVHFHRRLVQEYCPGVQPEDESEWIHSRGVKPQDYYPAYLARFLCHGVLLESYLETPHEAPFTRDVALPAFESVVARFGMKPLIVPLLPPETAADPSWTWYDREVEKFVVDELSSAGLLEAHR